MNNDEMLDRTDALLAECPRPAHAPFYRDATFHYKLRRNRQHPYPESKTEPPLDPTVRVLLRAELREVVTRARLSRRQVYVLNLWLDGQTLEDIAARDRVSRQMLNKVFWRLIEKIRAAYAVYPYAGLGEVFREEISRGRPRPAYGTMPG